MKLEKLRIGLIVDDFKVYNWIFEVISQISNSNDFNLKLVILTNEIPKNKKKNLLFQKFMKYDQQKYSLNQDAFEIKSLLDIKEISNVESIKLTIKDDEFIPSELNKYTVPELDILLKFDSSSFIQQFVKFTNYGVWTYYFGEHNGLQPILYGVQEFLENKNVTKITLSAWINRIEPKEVILFNSYSKTDKNSLHRSLNNSLWKTVSFIPRNLKELYQLGPSEFYSKKNQMNSAPIIFYDKPYKIPNTLNLCNSILHHISRKIELKITDHFNFHQWIVLFRLNKNTDISTTLFEFKRITPPKDRFWADPFVVYKDNTYYIFIEELKYDKNKGTIVLIEMNEKGEYKEPKPILEKDYHLSYPFIIEDSGKYYMIPETKENKTVEIYECENFPLKWTFKEILFNNIEAVDSTILKHNGKYWLFTNIKENSGTFTSDDELFLFYSNSLINGDWIPHPQNPIVSDVRYARPAGKIIQREGRLYRPAQNCSKHYGYGIHMLEITILNEESYHEIKINEILPNWEEDLISTHTINNEANITVIDAKIKRSNL
ncbi:hypothetical protein KCTC52924_02929 [Arenibacter antarcticus]|uniref:Glucosamine inositolphosphorylceramide transferase 1 N-terminal domain-containing protein n=1 Tax=Arenibacter antarcticus TaxID=2040469 RepID=A0ABW5VJQ2_9FLAO|nr:hypothetical protein [Arenibacter sp. H213]MCM4167346.1 hypothetical protein [Arenibacter sp. H213]